MLKSSRAYAAVPPTEGSNGAVSLPDGSVARD
jgi:hypothetical protein